MQTASFVFQTVFPVFSIIAVGFWLAGRRQLDLSALAHVAVMVTAPCLIFRLMAQTALEASRLLTLVGGGVWMVALTGLAAVLLARGRMQSYRGFLLPVMFWNAGNMALPIAQLAFGEEGLRDSAVLFVTVITLQATVGIWIAKGRDGFREVFRVPLLYGAALGMLVAGTGSEVPALLMRPVQMLGDMTIPLMLLNLGIQLRRLDIADLKWSAAAAALRMVGGVIAMALFVVVFSIGGLERSILLLGSVMPPAVINALFAQRYGTSPGLVASAIVLGTLASLIAVPAMLAFLA